MKTSISISLCLMSISFVDMIIIQMLQSKEYDDITILTKGFCSMPFIVFLMAFCFVMNTLVMKKPICFLLSAITFGYLGIFYSGYMFLFDNCSDIVLSNIIKETKLFPIYSIFSILKSLINEENARSYILSICLAMSLTMLFMASSAYNLFMKDMTVRIRRTRART